MKRKLILLTIGALLLMTISGCTGLISKTDQTIPVANKLPEVISEESEIIIPEPVKVPFRTEVQTQWKQTTHHALSEIAAKDWGLSTSRVNNMADASEMPDEYQSGLDNGFNQQWSHAYLYSSFGFWIWGDADDDFYDNIDQDGGEFESPEGYNGKSAKYYYQAGNQYMGDWYVGYACHYIEDVSLILHASDPALDMLTKHFNFEAWVANNWTTGHNFYGTVAADHYYYEVTDLKAAIRNAAKGSSYWTSDLGKNVWDNYRSSDCPTGAGTGNSDLVYYTKQMLIRAARYTKGAIKYALNTYNQW